MEGWLKKYENGGENKEKNNIPIIQDEISSIIRYIGLEPQEYLSPSDKDYTEKITEKMGEKMATSIQNRLANLYKSPPRKYDSSKKIKLGEDKKDLGFLRNATISEDAISKIKEYSTKYGINPYELTAALGIERSGIIDTSGDYNVNTIVSKRAQDLGIPLTGDYVSLAKEVGAFQKDGTINFNKVNNKYKEILSNIKKLKYEIESQDDMERMASFISKYGLESVNPKQQTLPGVKKDYVSMIKDASEYIKTKNLFENNNGSLQSGGEVNANEEYVSIPPNFVGSGYDISGRRFSPAWGGQFEDGGKVKKSFNPNLAKTDLGFQKWYKENTLEGQNLIPYTDDQAYDYYSFYKNNEHINPEYNIDQHFPDTYKRPSHPTFSNESIYSTPKNPGGQWKGEEFNPKGKFIYEDGGALQKIAGYHPVVAGAKKLMSNFAENVNPFEYENTVGRIGKNAVLNQKSLRRIEDEKNPDEQFKERADLLNILANKEQKYNSIPLSEYKPQKSKGTNNRYYKSPSTEQQLQEYIDEHWTRKNILSKADLPKMRSKALGNMMLDYGTDEKGNYISYYDKWDLNPVPQTGINWIDKAVDKVVTGVPNALGITNTPEVYGRVYLPEKRNGGELKKLEDLTNFGQIYKNKWLQKYE